MPESIQIVALTHDSERPCIVCGDLTNHSHSFSNKPKAKVPVCIKCCNHGCGNLHGIIEKQARNYHCKECKITLPVEKCGKVMDKFLCPHCQNVMDPR